MATASFNSTPATAIEAAPGALCELGAHVSDLSRDARDHWNINAYPTLVECLRQRKGEYSPEEMVQMGSVKTFVNVTSTKCRAGEAWLDDVMASVRERPWTITPTPVPNVPAFVRDMVVSQIRDEISALGVSADQAETYVRERATELRDISRNILARKAREAADRMSDKIADQLQEGGFYEAFSQFRNDLMTYPYAVLRGPDVRMKKVLRWGASAAPEVREEPMMVFERVSPFDFWWSKHSTSVAEADTFEAMRMTRSKLYACINLPHFDELKVRFVLERYTAGHTDYTNSTPTRDRLEGVASTLGPTDTIECIRFCGEIEGRLLQDWGIPNIDDELKMYQVDLWVIDGICIRAVLNPDPLGQKIYHVSAYEKVAGSFMGKSPPMLMKPHQEIINSAYRALRRNMGLASGPFAEVDQTRLAGGQAPEEILPGMVKLVEPDLTGNNAPVYRFHQIDSRAAELVNVINHEVRQCDDATGIPAYSYGNSSVSGAGRTVGGLAMLMGNASKGIKKVIGHTEDDVLKPVVTQAYNYNMLFDPDQTLKVDAQVVARGPTGIIMREALIQRRLEALQIATPYAQAGIIPREGISTLLREVFRGLDLEVDDIIPDPKRQAAIEGAAAQIQAGGGGIPNAQMPQVSNAPPAGQGTIPNPAGQGQVAMVPGKVGQSTVPTVAPDRRSGPAQQALAIMGAA